MINIIQKYNRNIKYGKIYLKNHIKTLFGWLEA